METAYITIVIPLGLKSVYSTDISKSIIALMGEYNWSLSFINNSQPETASITYSERQLIFSKSLSKENRLTDPLYILFTDMYIYNEEDFRAKLATI